MIGVPRKILLTSLIAVLGLVLAACAGGGAPSPADGTGAPSTIRVALDWTPNTNHTGLYVAQQKGWFRDAGLDVQILPYNDTSPDTLVSSGAAEFGVSFQDSFTVSKAAGADIMSVMAVLQHWATEIAVRADRTDITSPKDLDGKTYGGFGAAYEAPKMTTVIKNAGGKGDFKTVVLGTSAYEALYAGQVDFTEPFVAWEGIQAEKDHELLKTFAYTDYGFPDAYSVVLIGNSPWLAAHPDLARKFVQAAQRGYQLAADDPAQGAQLLMAANPGAFPDADLVNRSQAMLSATYMRDAAGKVGPQTLAQWSGYSGWVYDSGALTGPDGAQVSAKPDFATWFSNDYLAQPSP